MRDSVGFADWVDGEHDGIRDCSYQTSCHWGHLVWAGKSGAHELAIVAARYITRRNLPMCIG